MQSHVDNMEQQMSKVNDDMKKISGLSDKINGTLSSRRTKIDQLSTMHRLLKKVTLISLPLIHILASISCRVTIET
jgi:hypothetical protein